MSSTNKPIVSTSAVHLSHDTFQVLKNINLSIQQGEKIGLVGPNGSGKTTLLRIIAGLQTPSEGVVTHSKNIRIGYIPQEFTQYNESTVADFLQQSQDGTSLNNEELGDQKVSQDFLVEFQKISHQLHIDASFLQRKLSELSGGEKTKVALIRILLADQNVLLLDEPTNNLDIEALTFLENYIKKSNKTFLIISHDRAFLDKTVSRIFEIDEFERNLHIYEGNYSSYIHERRERLEREWEVHSDDVEKHAHIKEIIDQKLRRAEEIGNAEPRDNDKMLFNKKVAQGQTAYQQGAKHLKNRLTKMEAIEKPKEPLPLHVTFTSDERSGTKVFDIKAVVKKLPQHTLGPIDLSVSYGDRLLVTGQNGVGKTTLIKLLLGLLLPDSGTIARGTRLHLGYLPQQEDFASEATVRDEFLRLTQLEEGMARRTLHRFKLTTDDVEKKIKDLSSGERSRLTLATLMARDANCIILDEPSNHLDFEVLESLEDALRDFKGTLIVVSHDRFFIERLGNMKVINIENGRLTPKVNQTTINSD